MSEERCRSLEAMFSATFNAKPRRKKAKPKPIEEPRPVRCAECEGAGTFERVVGEDRSGMGGVSPITAEAGCEDCNGEGLKGCAWCGETPAFQYDPTGDVECLSCHKELLED
jgi:DnaJ-class molecular chaperone|tara:strand:+ start:140 stop:475 length:336 start_codon:yes stop_codon:yes gene_type:complete